MLCDVSSVYNTASYGGVIAISRCI